MRKPSTRYAEFACASNFSFLRGASHPEELIGQAAHLELAGLGLCDRNSVAGVVRAHLARRENKLAPAYHPGARLVFADGAPDILAYPRDRAAWGRLCRLLTVGNLRARKGDCILGLGDLLAHADGLELVVMEDSTRGEEGQKGKQAQSCVHTPLQIIASQFDEAKTHPPLIPAQAGIQNSCSIPSGSPLSRGRAAQINFDSNKSPCWLHRLREAAPGRVRLAAAMHYRGGDRARLAERAALAREAGVPLIAVNDVLYHHPDRRELQDVLTCIRQHVTIDAAGRRLAVNAERHLKPAQEMARLFRDHPEAIEETLKLDAALGFSLDELKYEYPVETMEGFASAQEALEHLTWEGAQARYPEGIDDGVRKSLANEFALIASRDYAPYFLTVYDIVRYARSRGILCQGRGSAANSTVCYCLGITSVDPVRGDLLFERFISTERNEPPDIDVDFEHGRREEAIQYIYEKYGRDRAGIAATVISYRGRSAVREIGKAFGLSEDAIGALASSIWGMGGGAVREDDLVRVGLDLSSPRVEKMRALVREIQGFPRHLSQHVGGFVITRSRLDEVTPVMNGAMKDRTHIEWDKDDLDALGILKVDVLGLGMLTCIRKAFALTERHYGETCTLSGLLQDEDPAVYRMLCRADSVGVFQVESRAQMSMLPRLKPQKFYDLVIEVAIVRPGPIQGDMVHPYLRRRQGLEKPEYPSPKFGPPDELKKVLEKTLGVPLFQEQAMKIAIVAGGFTPGEADRLRRAMATFKRTGTIGSFRHKMIEGMTAKGYEREFAERCFSQIEGFGEYGFPESHAASFALLVYVSAWLKCHYPDVFAAALLNAQPMGFYATAQIVRDVREHGVEVRGADVNFSAWDSTLEPEAFAGEAAAGSPPGNPPSCNAAARRSRAALRLHDLHRDMRDDIRTTHALRLGLREIKGLSEGDAQRIVAQRSAAYISVHDLWRRTGVGLPALERLADADAFASLGLSRRQALWAAKALRRVGDQDDLPLAAYLHSATEPASRSFPRKRESSLPAYAFLGPRFRGDERTTHASGSEPVVVLPEMTEGEEVVHDYRALRLSLRAHPASFLRDDLAARRIVANERLRAMRSGEFVRVSGLVTIRQRPGSANGVIFMTLEDETAIANIIVWPKVFARFRPIVLGARYVAVGGRLQAEADVIHVVANRLDDLTPLLARLTEDLPPVESLCRADAVKRPHSEDRPRPRLPGRIPSSIGDTADVAADLDTPARGSAHAPTRKRNGR
jgi:error-prone DNA polymerase